MKYDLFSNLFLLEFNIYTVRADLKDEIDFINSYGEKTALINRI